MNTIEQLKADLARTKAELKELNKKNRINLGRADRCIVCKNAVSSKTNLCLTHLSERITNRDKIV